MKRIVIVLLGVLLLMLALAGSAGAKGSAPKATGNVAVSPEMEQMVGDVMCTTQAWITFDAHSAVGVEGERGYRPAKGTLYYHVDDCDTGLPLYELSFAVVGCTVSGKAASFTLDDGRRVDVVDGGEPYLHDTMSIVYPGGSVPHPLYAGNLQVH